MKGAAKGDGSWYEVSRRGQTRWEVALVVPGRKTPVRQLLPLGATEVDARKALSVLRDQRARNELNRTYAALRAADRRLPTLRESIATWVWAGCPGGRRSKAAEEDTQHGYERLVDLALRGRAIADMRIDRLRRRHVEDLLIALARDGWRRSSLVMVRGILARVCDHAQMRFEDEMGTRPNPADVEIPNRVITTPTRQRRALDAAEITNLLTAVDGHRLLDARVHLGLDIGARPGELAALEWPDIDHDARTATITKNVAWVKGKPVLRHTKTGEDGHRRVTFSARTGAVLREHRKRTAAARLRASKDWPAEQDGVDLTQRVFRTQGGLLLTDKAVAGPLDHLCKSHDLPRLAPYDLRHSAATVVAKHRGQEVVARMLGHAIPGGGKVTAGYVHRELETVEGAVLDLLLGAVDNAEETGTGD